jgi:hypothetical protein
VIALMRAYRFWRKPFVCCVRFAAAGQSGGPFGTPGAGAFRPWFGYAEGYNGYLFAPSLQNIHIFNAGVKVPLPQQKAIVDIKYDPSLPPLPEKARAALDDLVKSRAYDRFRLSLIGGPS